MHNYRLTPSAKSDLIEIWNYTVEIWGEKQAEKYLQEIRSGLGNVVTALPNVPKDKFKVWIPIESDSTNLNPPSPLMAVADYDEVYKDEEEVY